VEVLVRDTVFELTNQVLGYGHRTDGRVLFSLEETTMVHSF